MVKAAYRMMLGASSFGDTCVTDELLESLKAARTNLDYVRQNFTRTTHEDAVRRTIASAHDSLVLVEDLIEELALGMEDGPEGEEE